VAFDDSGIGKNARKPFEFRKAGPEHIPCRGQDILLKKYVRRDRCRQRNQGSRRHRGISPVRVCVRRTNIMAPGIFERCEKEFAEEFTKN
jgi:hypothetical protein